MKKTNWSVYGMTPEQVLKIRDFWLRHHEELPKPEPTFKEVTMYAPVLKINEDTIVSCLYKSIDECMMRMGVIGYVEMKVFLKSEGEENERSL